MGKEILTRFEAIKSCNPVIGERVAEHSVGLGVLMSTRGGGAPGFALGATGGVFTGLAHGKHTHNLCMESHGHSNASFSEIGKSGGCTIS